MKLSSYFKGAAISTILLLVGLSMAFFGGITVFFSWEILENTFFKWGVMLMGMILLFAGVILTIFSQYFPRES